MTSRAGLTHGPHMAGRARGEGDAVIDPGALDDLLPLAIRIVAEQGDTSEHDLSATLANALGDPAFESRLIRLLSAEGVSPEHQKEYLRIFAEWRRAAVDGASAIDQPVKPPKPGS